jgi:mono/diheme cytochrome c family protein
VNPSTQAITAALGALIGCCSVPFHSETRKLSVISNPSVTIGFGWVLIIFTMLIWLDSAAFFIIQNSRALVEGTWGGSGMLWRNAFVHLGAALLAGWWLEKRRSLTPAAWAFIILAVASWFVNAKFTLWLGGTLYPAGVSLYSTCLVAFPAYLLAKGSHERRTLLAAVQYAVAGWMGSRMGIGMAENLQAVPAAFILVATVLVGVAFGYPFFKHRLREIGACAALLSIAVGLSSGRTAPIRDYSIDHGREVYLSEGCIHCHSRYVRPHAADQIMWGPYVSYQEALKENPPLFGNRQQGPDLLNVGLRRSRAWMKQHFIDPRSLAPGSAMPNYAYLFKDERGQVLLEYLMQPHGAFDERYQTVQAWQLPPETPSGDMEHRWQLYQNHCVMFHGDTGHGQGPVGRKLDRAPANLRDGPFVYSADRAAIPNIIKFGVMGTDMPGHEYLSNEDIAALTAYVNCLRTTH